MSVKELVKENNGYYQEGIDELLEDNNLEIDYVNIEVIEKKNTFTAKERLLIQALVTKLQSIGTLEIDFDKYTNTFSCWLYGYNNCAKFNTSDYVTTQMKETPDNAIIDLWDKIVNKNDHLYIENKNEELLEYKFNKTTDKFEIIN